MEKGERELLLADGDREQAELVSQSAHLIFIPTSDPTKPNSFINTLLNVPQMKLFFRLKLGLIK